MTNSSALNQSPCSMRTAKWWGGSQTLAPSGSISLLLSGRLIARRRGGVVVLGRRPSDAGVKGGDQPVGAPAGGELVVVLGHERLDGVRELRRERGAIA